MSDPRITKGDINAAARNRATLFLEPEFSKIMLDVYGARPVPLDINVHGETSICGYRIRRPLLDRFTLAPFNFQPVLADRNEEITDALIRLARNAGPNASAQIRLHHALSPEFACSRQLAQSEEIVETLLPLGADPIDIFGEFPKKQRWKFRKAQSDSAKSGVQVRRFEDEQSLREFYRLLVRAYQTKHRMIPQPYSLFQKLLALSRPRRGCHGYVAERIDTGELLGGIFVMRDEIQWNYGWAANAPSREAEALGLGTLLVGTAIAEAAEQGASVFSFGMSPLTHESLRSFKRNWGAQEHPVYTYYWREKPRPVDLHRDYAVAKMLIARVPTAVVRMAAPVAVRWLV